MSHTPGPWRVTDLDTTYAVKDAVGDTIVMTGTEADAALIADAPHLLGVLDAVIASIDVGHPPDEDVLDQALWLLYKHGARTVAPS